jgi:hypothetical protein
MTAVTESDIKELKDLINTFRDEVKQEFNAIDKRLTSIENRLSPLELGQARIEGQLEAWKPSMAKITDLAEKVGELKNWRQAGLIIATAMISSIFSGTFGGVIGWFLRSGNRI